MLTMNPEWFFFSLVLSLFGRAEFKKSAHISVYKQFKKINCKHSNKSLKFIRKLFREFYQSKKANNKKDQQQKRPTKTVGERKYVWSKSLEFKKEKKKKIYSKQISNAWIFRQIVIFHVNFSVKSFNEMEISHFIVMTKRARHKKKKWLFNMEQTVSHIE